MKDKKKESLLKLAEIAKKRGDCELPPLTKYEKRLKMPHELDIEIGERLIRKLIQK